VFHPLFSHRNRSKGHRATSEQTARLRDRRHDERADSWATRPQNQPIAETPSAVVLRYDMCGNEGENVRGCHRLF
jgi:hypothetical protein